MTAQPDRHMTRHATARRTGQAVFIAALVVASLALTACSQDSPAQTVTTAAGALPSVHVHGVSRDPGSGKVNLATHTGLFVLQQDKSWQRVGPEVDLMSFAVSAAGTFYASGHPAAGVDLPSPVGLITSTDAGRTWTSLSRGGESDFHALTASPAGVVAFDDVLRTTVDGKTWATGGLTAAPRTLAASPDGSQVLATTNQGLLRSTDQGRTWVPVASAPEMFLTAWADSKTVVAVTTGGEISISQNAGRSWKAGGATVSSAQALSASRDQTGVLEILVVTDTGVMQSLDDGTNLTPVST